MASLNPFRATRRACVAPSWVTVTDGMKVTVELMWFVTLKNTVPASPTSRLLPAEDGGFAPERRKQASNATIGREPANKCFRRGAQAPSAAGWGPQP